MRYLPAMVVFLLLVVLTGCGEDKPADPPADADARRAQQPQRVGQSGVDDGRELEPVSKPDVDPEPGVLEPLESLELLEASPQPAPPYDGEWITLGNGMRFGMRPVKPEFYRNEEPIQLLIYVENTSAREVAWVPFRTDPSVRMPQYVADAGMSWRPTYDPNANLRVWVHRLRPRSDREGVGIPSTDADLTRYEPETPITLEPGQVWVTTLRIFPSRVDEGFQNRYITDATCDIVWHQPLFTGGDFRVRVRYQAGGFEPPPGPQYGGPTRAEPLEGWGDVWVQFADLDTHLLN